MTSEINRVPPQKAIANGLGNNLGQAACFPATLQLDGIINELTARLQPLEPFRALVQLDAREAEGWPISAVARQELVSHLEAELIAHRDYRAWRLLRHARAELAGETTGPLQATPAAVRPAPGDTGASPKSPPVAIAPPVLATSKAEPAPALVTAINPPSNGAALTEDKSPANDSGATGVAEADAHVAEAEAGVMALLAKLRAPGLFKSRDSGARDLTLLRPVNAPQQLDAQPMPLANRARLAEAQIVFERPVAPHDTGVAASRPSIACVAPKTATAKPAVVTAQPAKIDIPVRAITTAEADTAEIRFVARSANSLTDILPKPVAPPTIVLTCSIEDRLAADLAAGNFEEASVEIRRPGGAQIFAGGLDASQADSFDAAEGHNGKPGGSSVLSLFSRALRRDRA